MTDVMVCVKRVPDAAGAVLLTDDGMRVDARHVGYTTSAHDESAVELATQVAASTDGGATVLTLGDADATEQLRDALALGCTAAVRIDADADAYGPVDVAAAIADVVRRGSYDLVLLGNDAADTGDFQVGVRLAYQLGWPVVAGASVVEVHGDTAVVRADSPDGFEVYEITLPAVVTVLEGGVEPRYPTIPGRMKAKRAPVEVVQPATTPVGSGRVRLTLPPAQPSRVSVLGEGSEAAPAVVDLLLELGVVAR